MHQEGKLVKINSLIASGSVLGNEDVADAVLSDKEKIDAELQREFNLDATTFIEPIDECPHYHGERESERARERESERAKEMECRVGLSAHPS